MRLEALLKSHVVSDLLNKFPQHSEVRGAISHLLIALQPSHLPHPPAFSNSPTPQARQQACGLCQGSKKAFLAPLAIQIPRRSQRHLLAASSGRTVAVNTLWPR